MNTQSARSTRRRGASSTCTPFVELRSRETGRKPPLGTCGWYLASDYPHWLYGTIPPMREGGWDE
jgi:hypothetical protein